MQVREALHRSGGPRELLLEGVAEVVGGVC